MGRRQPRTNSLRTNRRPLTQQRAVSDLALRPSHRFNSSDFYSNIFGFHDTALNAITTQYPSERSAKFLIMLFYEVFSDSYKASQRPASSLTMVHLNENKGPLLQTRIDSVLNEGRNLLIAQ
jgi:hypothetical protein